MSQTVLTKMLFACSRSDCIHKDSVVDKIVLPGSSIVSSRVFSCSACARTAAPLSPKLQSAPNIEGLNTLLPGLIIYPGLVKPVYPQA